MPHEEYAPYIPKFIFHALHNKSYTVFKGHKRIIDYVEESCKTLTNIVDNFKPGEVYNVGCGREGGTPPEEKREGVRAVDGSA